MNVRGWFSSAASTIASTLKSTYTFARDTIVAVATYPSFTAYANNFGVQFWEGFTRVADPNNLTKIVSAPRTQSTMFESFKSNVICYFSLAMLLDVTKNAILVRVVSGEDTWADSAITLTMNSFVMVGMTTIMIHRYYDNTLLTMALAKQVSEEVPLSPHYKSCACDSGALIKAGVVSPINLTGKVLSIWAASWVPVVRYITPFAYTYAYGESLAEYPHAAAGSCTEHRAQQLAKENGYAFGLGASMYFVGEVTAFLLTHFTGANSIFISNAIYSVIYPYYVTAVLLRDRPLPNSVRGVDFYYYHRYLTDHMVTTIGGQILPMLQSRDKTIDWNLMLKRIVNAPLSLVVRHILSYDLYGDWSSPHAFVLSPVNKLFFDEYYGMIINEINKIIDLREKPIQERSLKDIPTAILAPVIPVLPNRLTRFVMSDSYKKLVKIILADWMEDPLKASKRFFEQIHHIQINANVKILSDHDPRWEQAMNQEAKTRVDVSPVIEEIPDQPNEAPPTTGKEIIAVTTSSQGVFALPQQANAVLRQRPLQNELIAKKHQFLLNLREVVFAQFWDTKGTTLFGTCTPEKIDNLRTTLKSLNMHSGIGVINKVFDQVKDLFANYRAMEGRDPAVEKLYRLVVHNIGIIVNNSIDDLQSLSQSTELTKRHY
jgi:hypothetical protein